MNLSEKMRRKGWSKKELSHLDSVLVQHEARHRASEAGWFWAGLVAITLASTLTMIFLLPVLLVAQTAVVSIITLSIGLIFGFLFEHFILGLERISHRHFRLAAIVVILVGITSLVMIMTVAERLRSILPFAVAQSWFLPAVCYALGFSMPHFLHDYIENIQHS